MIFGCNIYLDRIKIFFVLIVTATTGMGAAYGTAKSGIGIAGIGTYRPDLIMKVNLLLNNRPLMFIMNLTPQSSPLSR
jgi:hypothetical protein